MQEASDQRPLIGEILIKRNVITPQQLEEALSIQKQEKCFLGEILVKHGHVEERDIVVALVVQCGFPYIAINKCQIDSEVLKKLPKKVCQENHLIPMDCVGDILSLVMTNPLSDSKRQEIENLTGCKIATFISTKTEIEQAISKWYPA